MLLPLFEGGLRQAELAGAKAAFELAAAQDRVTEPNAVQDVKDNFPLLRWLRQAIKDADAAVAAAQRSVSMALTLTRDGAKNYLQVITA